MLPDDYGFGTHCEILATTGGGKSKGAESNARECVRARCGIDVIDWKSSLSEALLAWLAHYRPRVPIVDFRPAGPHAVPFNVFAAQGDPEEHAVRMAEALLKCQGDDRAGDFPMYRETLPMLLAWCAATGETVQSASRLLHFHNRDSSLTAAGSMRTDHLRDKWRSASLIKNEREWDYRFGSTRRKLEPFLHEGPLRRLTSAPGCLDYAKLREDDGILLADLSGMSGESARIFAALILSLMLRASAASGDEIPRFGYLDEPQEYETADMASLLNLSRSSGLRLTLMHHHSGQWKDRALAGACEANARLKYVMNGVPFHECRKFAEERFLPQLNERWAKEIRYRTQTEWDEEDVQSITERDGESGDSVTHGSRLRPYQERVPDGFVDWTREEKLSMLTEPLVALRPREYCRFTPDGDEWGTFPHLKDYGLLLNPAKLLEFRESLHAASPDHEHPAQEKEQAGEAGRSRNEPSAKRAKKGPADLFPQG